MLLYELSLPILIDVTVDGILRTIVGSDLAVVVPSAISPPFPWPQVSNVPFNSRAVLVTYIDLKSTIGSPNNDGIGVNTERSVVVLSILLNILSIRTS